MLILLLVLITEPLFVAVIALNGCCCGAVVAVMVVLDSPLAVDFWSLASWLFTGAGLSEMVFLILKILLVSFGL